MTVEASDTVDRYTIAGVGPYRYSFRIFAATDLALSAGSVATPPVPAPLTYLTHYTVAGVNDADGGTVTLTAAAAATYAGYILDIRSNTPNTQPTSIRNIGRFLPEIHEDAFDRLSRQIQDLERRLESCIRFPDNALNSGELTPLSSWADRYLYVNPSGEVTPSAGVSSVTLTRSVLAALLFPQTAAESSSGITPTDFGSLAYPYDVRRAGIVPNSTGARAANTTAMRALVDATSAGIVGWIFFPNTTGSDIYHFSDVLAFRDGIRVDLNGCTLKFTASGADATKQDAGFIFAIRDFALINGTIDVDYATGGSNQGQAMVIGSRNVGASSYFGNTYDSALSSPQGNVLIRNVKFTSNHPSAYMVYLTGGLRNVTFEDIDVDGQNACGGIYYEFGWATNEASAANRQTSHAHNMTFRNIRAVNLVTSSRGVALQGNGAYGVTIENVHQVGGQSASVWGTGESLFYRPWVAPDLAMAKRHIMMRNINAKDTASTAIVMTGAVSASGGYLAATIAALGHPADYVAQTDLLDYTLDGFSVDGAAGYGVNCAGGHATIRNGKVTECQRGIVTTTECVEYAIDGVEVLNCTSIGIQIGLTADKWVPGRFSRGSIKNCKIAGSGTAGNTVGISLVQTQRCLIQNNRFGFDVTHDGVAETTQTYAVSAGTTASGVVCDGNYVADCVGGLAYNKTSGPADCILMNPQGIATTTGVWRNGKDRASTITYSASMTPDCSLGNEFVITASNGTAFAINAPLYPMLDQRITIKIRNTSGGALGAITWNAVFKMATFTAPATANSRSVDFKWNGSNWIEIARTPADVPN